MATSYKITTYVKGKLREIIGLGKLTRSKAFDKAEELAYQSPGTAFIVVNPVGIVTCDFCKGNVSTHRYCTSRHDNPSPPKDKRSKPEPSKIKHASDKSRKRSKQKKD